MVKARTCNAQATPGASATMSAGLASDGPNTSGKAEALLSGELAAKLGYGWVLPSLRIQVRGNSLSLAAGVIRSGMLISCVQNVLKTLPLSVGRAPAHEVVGRLPLLCTACLAPAACKCRTGTCRSRSLEPGSQDDHVMARASTQGQQQYVSPFESALPLDPVGFEEIERAMERSITEDARRLSASRSAPLALCAAGPFDDALSKLSTEQAARAAAEAAATLSAEEAQCLQLRLAALQHSTVTLQARNAELEAHLDAATSELPAKEVAYEQLKSRCGIPGPASCRPASTPRPCQCACRCPP
jgi:hypothetical protein